MLRQGEGVVSIVFSSLLFILGLLLGSFFNVVGLRLPNQVSFVTGRSACPNCEKQLSWYELIPVISYVLQVGKCRHCNNKISIVYPIIELTTGLLFALSYLHVGLSIELIVMLSLISMLMIIFVTDLSYMLIPNKVLIFFLPIFVILRVIEPLDPWWTSITGGVVAFVLIALIIIVSRGGMGGGDLKLFTLLGIVLGLKQVLLAFFLACIIGTIIGVVQLMFKKIKRKEHIPFGPYIVMGTIITCFYGDVLLDWYGSLF